ncbi:SDR family NAD(P)-dependent oxidoreductase [Microvirga sp. 2YAF29]|uniref:SDR family NAD(P)-dependent oxidoreductase n=1 Tax=Microvirga sp. 2YAF29 TaxID=3233031 RepID=UPI003F9CA225
MRDVVLVTGGGRGIGAAIVRAAASRGYAVCFSYLRDNEAAGQLVNELKNAGHEAYAIRGDVADAAFAQTFFDEAEATFGPCTALVNNAGITGRIGLFRDADHTTMRKIPDTMSSARW